MTDAPSPPSYLDDFPRGRQTAGSDASFLHPAPSSTQDAQDESQYEGLMTVHNRASYHYPDSRDGKASNRLRAFVSAAAVSFGLAALALISMSNSLSPKGTFRSSSTDRTGAPNPACRDIYAEPGCEEQLPQRIVVTLTLTDWTDCIDRAPPDLHRGRNASDILWIPYTPEVLALSTSAPSVEGSNDLPLEVLSHAAPSYNRALLDGQSSNIDLSWMRDKNIALLGSSFDRNALESFCGMHPGATAVSKELHRFAYCTIPDLNFTLQAWFHFGLHQDDYFKGYDKKGAPNIIEDRISDIFVPLSEDMTGKPDMIIFASGYWDLNFLRYQFLRRQGIAREQALNDAKAVKKAVTWDEFAWHRHRLGEAIAYLRAAFPEVPVMYRTTTYSGHSGAAGTVVFRLNHSARAVLSRLNVPVFPCADLLVGETEYKDKLHFKPESRQDWLYADIMLHYLRMYSTPACRGV